MKKVILAHYSRIGHRGGVVSSPAKCVAARLNALKRWHSQSFLPLNILTDGMWYRGEGRNAAVGLWDAQNQCFWTITMNDFANPVTFPTKPRRQIRLKREDYFSIKSGSFKPVAPLVP